MISIITPTFNSHKYIKSTYDCLLSQTITNWEWLVTDDCSTDGTFDIIKNLAKADDRIKPEQTMHNSGAAVARNCSILRSKGDFIAFIDSDDLWVSQKLEKQILFMGKNINFSFTAYEIVNSDAFPLNRFVDVKNSGSFNYEDMLRKKATIGCSTVILRRSAFRDLMMPLLRTGQDYALWLKLLKSGDVAYLLNQPLTKYRIVSNSISRNKLKKARRQWQIYRDIEQLSLLKSIECFIFYVFRAIPNSPL